MNIYDVLIAVAVAIVLFFAVKGTVKNKNKGCGGDCFRLFRTESKAFQIGLVVPVDEYAVYIKNNGINHDCFSPLSDLSFSSRCDRTLATSIMA